MTDSIVSRINKTHPPKNFGLANQLFQIATTYAYARRNGLTATFPDVKNTEMQGPYLDTIFRNLETGHDDLVSFCRSQGRVYYEPTFTYTEIPNGMKDFLFDGYYQSEKYFSDYADEIRELFSIDTYTEEKILKITEDISDLVTMQIRRGDYVDATHLHVDLCSTEYYKNALSSIKPSVVYVLSDDVEWSKKWIEENFSESGIEFRWTNENDVFDLYLMSVSDVCIMANSTFGWWGAWLGKEKKTIAPSKWFNEEQQESTASDIYHPNCTIINTDIK